MAQVIITHYEQENKSIRDYETWCDCEGRRAHKAPIIPYNNLWLGVTAENQATADERIPLLLQTPAAVRFVSCEPLLGSIDLRHVHHDGTVEIDSLTGDHGVIRPLAGRSDLKLNWVICGGESGPGARPMHPDWARSLRDQCQAAGVPFHFKLHGEYGETYRFNTIGDWIAKAPTHVHGAYDRCIDARGQICLRGSDFMKAEYPISVMTRVGKKYSGRLLDGREWLEFPQGKLL